jgi:hypothetical protein
MTDDTPDLIRGLRALASVRRARGDQTLVLCPNPIAQELLDLYDTRESTITQGLVLEPYETAAFETRPLAPRKQHVAIKAFCDGTRSTYFLGTEDLYPLLYTHNASVVRTREETTGYHDCMYRLQRKRSLLLAPFDLFPSPTRRIYQRLGLYTHRLADLCWTGPGSEEYAPTPSDMLRMGNLAWQSRARRRARHLLDISEQITSIAGARLLREQDPTGLSWLLKDGSFFQFSREYLSKAELLRNVVSCVKMHPVPFFGIEGERKIRQLEIGQRSVAFLPRPSQEAQQKRTLGDADRPMVSWYLRVCSPDKGHPRPMNGIVRLDMAAVVDWRQWVDDVSWAVLDEFYGISARPDPRYDVMPYGIYDCEQFLKAQQLSGDLLLAQLT